LLLEAVAVLVILGGGFLLRWDGALASFPGFHGDEAIVGLESQRILREGWIGPYSPFALGQPTGPMYLTAVSVAILGDSITAIRIVPAILSAMTILALYLLVRRELGVACALVAATFLATMHWHVHFAHIGFPLSAWPLLATLAIAVHLTAIRRRSSLAWGAAGLVLGLGVHTYHVHLLLTGVLGVVAAVAMLRTMPSWRVVARWMAAYAAGLVVGALPMIIFALTPGSSYFNHARTVGVGQEDDWSAAGSWPERLVVLGQRYWGYWERMVVRPAVDYVDGSGVVALIPGAAVGLAGLGLWFVVRQRSRAPALLVICIVIILVIPLASVVTVDGAARRTLVSAPALAVLMAVGLVWPGRSLRATIAAWRQGQAAAWRVGAMVVVTVIATGSAGWVTWHNLRADLETVPAAGSTEWIFAEDLVAASRYLDGEGAGSYVYFLSDRWSISYETRQFLAPDVEGENRSHRFGQYSLDIDPSRGDVTFLLLGGYRDEIVVLRQRYPGGVEVVPGDATDPPFIAYRVQSDANP
jgi:4-amino-4-deoxy-L-arabinose transferase-like glycosyltransferase